MLWFDNEELKKQRNMDRLRMQSDWKRHMEGFSLQPTPRVEKTVHFPVQVKKELDHKVLVEAATYDRSSSWLDYKAHF